MRRPRLDVDIESSSRYAGAWSTRASCRSHESDAWFSDDHVTMRLAKVVCASCPVRLECLEYSLARPERHGIWGGLDTGERYRLIDAVHSNKKFRMRDQPTEHKTRARNIAAPTPAN